MFATSVFDENCRIDSAIYARYFVRFTFLPWIGATGERNFLPRVLDRQIEAEEKVKSERSGTVAEEK